MVTGPILRSVRGKIGSNVVSVPDEYYKVIYDPTGTPKMIAFVLPNQKGTKGLEEYSVSVDYVESSTGINFFPGLDDALENQLESRSNTSDWVFKQYTSSSSSSSTSTAVQCKGNAKSTGVRCKNRTTNENGYCHYHQAQASGTIKSPAPTHSSTVGRCQTITKAGTQCKRNAEQGRRYCWQHK